MSRVAFRPADDSPTFGCPGYVYRDCGAGSQLLEFQQRRVRVLSLEHGELQLCSYHRNGRPCHADDRLDLDALCCRGAHPDRTPEGQRTLFPLDPDAPAIHRFVQLIPAEIWQRVHCYPRWMQFRMLALFVNQGEAATRLHDCGCHGFVALMAAADWLRRRPTSRQLIRHWLDRPQAEVLAELTLPGTQRVARILRKIEAAACHYSLLRNLRCLHDARLAREVSHLPRLNTPVLDVLRYFGDGHRLVSPSCLRELSELDPAEAEAIRAVLDFQFSRHRRLERLIGEPLPRPTFANVKQLLSYSQLARHGDLPELSDTNKIPPPPFANVGGFVDWIRTPGELLREGEFMYHCVFSYLPLLMDGRAAAARVQAETERATVVIVRHADGLWHVRDLRRQFNLAPSDSLRERFTAWLAASNAAA